MLRTCTQERNAIFLYPDSTKAGTYNVIVCGLVVSAGNSIDVFEETTQNIIRSMYGLPASSSPLWIRTILLNLPTKLSAWPEPLSPHRLSIAF